MLRARALEGLARSSLALLVALACDRGQPTQPPSPAPPTPLPGSPPLPGSASGDPLALLVVDWPAADRAALERSVVEGAAILLVDGAVAPGCTARAEYRFVGERPHSERVDDRGATFEATIVGTWTARLGDTGLTGACERVTHFAHAISTGAFTAASRTDSHTRTEVEFGGVVVGGSSSSSSSRSTAGGERSACAAATPASPRPPARCGAFIRLALTPIAP